MNVPSRSNTTWTLPIYVTEANKAALGALTLSFVGIIYFLSNHLNLLAPRLLEMTALDQAVPFLPWTIWVYHSDIPMFIVAYALCRNLVIANKYLYTFLMIHLFSNVVFILWPTTFPRELFPLDPQAMDSATYHFFDYFRRAESPVNCFPSLHVSSVFVTALVFWGNSRWKTLLFMIWAIAISFSTLTTKQHYFADMLGGLFVAVIFYRLFFHQLNYAVTEKTAPEWV